MKSFLLQVLLFLFIGITLCYSSPQSDDLEKALKALHTKDFDTAKPLLERLIARNSFDAGGYYALSIYYSESDNKLHDFFKAYDYILLAKKYYSTLTTKERATLEKLAITQEQIEAQRQQIGQNAFQKALNSGNVKEMDKIAETFAALPEVMNKIANYRNELAYKETQQLNTYQAYQNFYIKHPDAKQAKEAKEKYESQLYEHLTSEGTWQAYEKFYKTYPESPYRLKAKQNYERLYFEHHLTAGASPSTYKKFIAENPTSPYAKKAGDQLEAYSSLFPVRIHKKWGFINGLGQVVIPALYEKTGNFCEGLARVRINGKWGFIDPAGQEVISAIYTNVRDFHEGISTVMLQRNGHLEQFFIDKIGKNIFNKVYISTSNHWFIHSFSEGIAAVQDPQTKKLGFINKSGTYIISPEFEYANNQGTQLEFLFSYFHQGYAWVKDKDGFKLIDKEGKPLVKDMGSQANRTSQQFNNYHSFTNGLCLVEGSKESYYINKQGSRPIVIPVGFTAEDFSDSVAWTYSKYENKYYLINANGKTVLELAAAKVYPFKDGLAIIQTEGVKNRAYFYDQTPTPAYTYINKEGKSVFAIKFELPKESIHKGGYFRNGLACIILDNKQTYINREGKIVWQSTESW